MTQSQKKAKRCDDSMDHPKYLGLNRRVAERLGIHEGHVSKVRRGHRDSGRVMAALREEMAKMDRERVAAERGPRA